MYGVDDCELIHTPSVFSDRCRKTEKIAGCSVCCSDWREEGFDMEKERKLENG